MIVCFLLVVIEIYKGDIETLEEFNGYFKEVFFLNWTS